MVEGELSCFIKRIVAYNFCIICKCLKPKSKRYRLLAKGRKSLAKETDIVNLIKHLRAIQTTLDMKLKLSSHQTEQVAKSKRETLKLTSDSDSDNSQTGK